MTGVANRTRDSRSSGSIVSELKPRMSAREIDAKLREVLGGYAERLSRIWLQYQNKIRDQGLVNKIEFTNFSGAQARAGVLAGHLSVRTG